MAHSFGRHEVYDEDHELIAPHLRSLADLDNVDGETVHLDEYLRSKSLGHGLGSDKSERQDRETSARPSAHVNFQRGDVFEGDVVPGVQAYAANSGWFNQKSDEQENLPPGSNSTPHFVSKPRHAPRGQKRQGTGRVAQRRSFGLDLKQLSLRQEDDDSEAEWEARDQELARQRAERSAQRRQEKERGGKRMSIGGPAVNMELDSDEDDVMEDFGGDGDMGWGQEEEEGTGSADVHAAWKTNPLFDGPEPEKAPAPEPEKKTPFCQPPPPEAPAATPPPSTQTPPPKTNTTSQTSLSAQAQKLAEQLLAKVGAAVSRAGGGCKSDGGTQTTPSLELLTIEERPRIQPPVLALPPPEPETTERREAERLETPPPSPAPAAGEGSPLPQDVNAAMAMAAQVAEDIDFPGLEGSPPPENTGEQQGPRKLAFGSPVEAGTQAGGEEQPEVLDDLSQEPTIEPPPLEAAASEQAAPAETHAIVRFVRRKPVEKFHRLKSLLAKSRKSLAGAGLTVDHGIRRSTRVRVRPLQWWRNESYDWERLHDSLPTISKVVLLSPDPIWPRTNGRAVASMKKRKTVALAKLPALPFSSSHKP